MILQNADSVFEPSRIKQALQKDAVGRVEARERVHCTDSDAFNLIWLDKSFNFYKCIWTYRTISNKIHVVVSLDSCCHVVNSAGCVLWRKTAIGVQRSTTFQHDRFTPSVLGFAKI